MVWELGGAKISSFVLAVRSILVFMTVISARGRARPLRGAPFIRR